MIESLVSIIIPIYNAERFLAATVDSVLAQNYQLWELILVDDGSTDHSADICNQYAAQHAHIRVIHQRNQGVSSARNAGLEIAQGEFVAFIDADDVITSDYLQTLCHYQKETNADLVGSWFTYVDENLNPISSNKHEEIQSNRYKAEHLDQFIRNNSFFFGVVWGKLLRKKLIDRYNIKFCETINYGEDTLFICCYASICNEVISISKKSYLYRQYDDSLSRKNIDGRIEQHVLMTEKYRDFTQKNHINSDFVQCVSSLWYYHILEDMISRRISLSQMRSNMNILCKNNHFCEYIRKIKKTTKGKRLRLSINLFLYAPRILLPYIFELFNIFVRCVIHFRYR